MRRRLLSRNRGFTLLEVLVALSILAISYAVILQVFGGAARKATLTGDYRRALIIAESRLDYATASVTTGNLQSSGLANDRFHWQLSYAPASEYTIAGVPARYSPVLISVEVSWSDSADSSRSVTISTLRLMRGAPG